MAGAIELFMDSLSGAVGFFLKNAKALTIGFAKVALFTIAFQLAVILVLTGASMVFGTPEINPTVPEAASVPEPSLPVILFLLVMMVFYFVVSSALAAVPYNIIDDCAAGRRTGILRRAIALIGPVGAFLTAIAATALVLFGVPLIAGLLLGEGGVIIVPLIMLASLLGLLALFVSVQFAVPEIAVRGADAITAMRRSYGIVKSNFWGVVLFDVLLVTLVFGLTLAFGLAQQIVSALVSASAANIPLLAVLFGLSIVLSVTQATVVSIAGISLTYWFWKGASG